MRTKPDWARTPRFGLGLQRLHAYMLTFQLVFLGLNRLKFIEVFSLYARMHAFVYTQTIRRFGVSPMLKQPGGIGDDLNETSD